MVISTEINNYVINIRLPEARLFAVLAPAAIYKEVSGLKLLSLTLRNFKGIKSFTLDAQGGNVDVYGDNATGKTTLFDAFLWILFDKDSSNKKDFEIKTLDKANEPVHGLEHEVEADLEVNGKIINLRKIYKEKWTKKRGSAAAEFTGHTTEYFIDGVPAKKGEYEARIAEIASEDIFKLLTSPTFFNEQLHWEKRRAILLEVCGDISDEEVIASDDKLAKLPAILQGRSLEDHKKVIAARRSKINDELKKIPVRIDEVAQGLPDLSELDAEKITAEIEQLKDQIKAKEQEVSRIESGTEITEKQNQIRTVEGELITLKNQVQGKISEQIDAKRRELQQVKSQLFNAQLEAKSKQTALENNQQKINQYETEMEDLRGNWHQVNDRQFSFQQEDTCPTCGQPLPADQLAAAREKAQADFNRTKAVQLGKITTRGTECRDRAIELQTENKSLDGEIIKANDKVAEYTQKSSDLGLIIENMMKDAEVYKEDPAYVAKLGEKQTLQGQIRQLQQDNAEAVGTVKKDIEQLGGTLLKLQTSLAKVEQHENGQKRIHELSDQERTLAAEYEKLEGELYLTEQFVKAKVNLLEKKINSKFKLARFKLFNTLVNGGVEECCETLYQGVPYSGGLNNAARINVGLDIINTLSEYYGFPAPIFVDNAEAVTQLVETRGQVIRLIVSEKDKALRVETTEEAQNVLFKEVV